MTVLYEDNHIIIVNKAPGEIVQADKTGDLPLCDAVRQYIKTKYNKPGNAFCGVVHRIDRPVGGVVIFAKTSKALGRLNDMLRHGEIHKTYWALVEGHREFPEDTLRCWLVPNHKNNKTYVCEPGIPESREAILSYKTLTQGHKYSLLEINLMTGRKHQIRAQLSSTGTPIKGDLKYGARRSNPDGSISLLARRVQFIHPVSHKEIIVEAPPTPEMLNLLQQITGHDS